MSEIGIRVYCADYVKDLLATKVPEIGIPWMLAKGKLLPVVDRLYERGLMVGHVRDEYNLGVCAGAFLLGHNLEVGVRCVFEDGRFRPEGSQERKIAVLNPKTIRGVFEQDATEAGTDWEAIRNTVQRLVDKIYHDGFVFLRLDAENTKAVLSAYDFLDEVDLPVRMRA